MSPKKSTKKEALKSVRGMRDIMGDEYYALQGFFEKAQEVAEYYGFKPIETPILEHEQIFDRGIGDGTDIVDKEMYRLKTKGGDKLVMRPEQTAAMMRAYVEHGMHAQPQPVMLYHYGPYFRHDRPQQGRYRQFHQFGLEVIGSDKSIMDALVIRVACLIYHEIGIQDVVVKINSIGDIESRKDYEKALTAYYRKHVNDLPATDRERLKKNPLRILDSKDPKTAEINAGAPEALNYLNSTSKKHFKRVLEHLDEMNIDYEIDNSLVRGLDYYSHTVVEFYERAEQTEPDKEDPGNEKTDKKSDQKDKEERTVLLALSGGGRYDYLGKTLGAKKDIPAVGCAIGAERSLLATKTNLSPKIKKKPKVYFIQLGAEAQLKSLPIIEILRKARIPTAQAISKEGLSAQLGMAEKVGAPFTIIFGQKEALDGSVIVRNMENRSQKTVKIDALCEYLKKLK